MSRIYLALAALALLGLSHGLTYWQGDRHGAGRIQARWDAANLQSIAAANRDREHADLSIPQLTDEDRAADRARPAVGKPCVVFDTNDRDCH